MQRRPANAIPVSGARAHTQQNLCHATGGARGQILDSAQGTTALLDILKGFRLHCVNWVNAGELGNEEDVLRTL